MSYRARVLAPHRGQSAPRHRNVSRIAGSGRAAFLPIALPPDESDAAAYPSGAGGSAGFAGVEKNSLKPWLRQQWVIPPKENAAFVAQMEDVL
ncbi:hypothetical protein, partial [Alienimonas sp. DA493]|uniref:hypothetical protein n=1 Tax=Alienimonas sp. DA493 TaxID=3373605 RepID=UPI003754DFB1